jgi:hypothetical protein
MTGHGAHKSRLIYECATCGRQHSLLKGTLFEQIKTGLACRRLYQCAAIRIAPPYAAPQASSVFCQKVLQRHDVQHRLRQQLL